MLRERRSCVSVGEYFLLFNLGRVLINLGMLEVGKRLSDSFASTEGGVIFHILIKHASHK